MSKPNPATDRAHHLIEQAFALSCEEGLGALTARMLGQRAGASASAVNYHFGSRERLLAEVHGEARRRAEAERAALRDQFAVELPPWCSYPNRLTAMVLGRLGQDRAMAVLLQEFEPEAAGSDDINLRDSVRAELAAERQFWREIAHEHGQGPEAAALWADLVLGLTASLHWEWRIGLLSMWIAAPVGRLYRRLERSKVTLSEIDAPAIALREGISTSETAARILEATIATIASRGVDRTTQREVAGAAKVGLASVTHFFPTRDELISAAFAELYRRHGEEQATPDDNEDRAYTMLAYGDPASRRGSLAAGALLTAAARKPELVPIAEQLRLVRGIGTKHMLQQRGFAVDQTDGYIWACVMMGRIRRDRYAMPSPNPSEYASSARSLSELIFR